MILHGAGKNNGRQRLVDRQKMQQGTEPTVRGVTARFDSTLGSHSANEDEASTGPTGIFISDFLSFLILTLMMQTESVSETLVFNSALTWLIAQEDFVAS
jgi:hypothetical protein